MERTQTEDGDNVGARSGRSRQRSASVVVSQRGSTHKEGGGKPASIAVLGGYALGVEPATNRQPRAPSEDDA